MDNTERFERLKRKIQLSEQKLDKKSERIEYFCLLIKKGIIADDKDILSSRVSKIKEDIGLLYLELECLRTELEILEKLNDNGDLN